MNRENRPDLYSIAEKFHKNEYPLGSFFHALNIEDAVRKVEPENASFLISKNSDATKYDLDSICDIIAEGLAYISFKTTGAEYDPVTERCNITFG